MKCLFSILRRSPFHFLSAFLCILFLNYIGIAQAEEPTQGLMQNITLDGEITEGGCDIDFPPTITFSDTDISKLQSSSTATISNVVTPTSTLPVLAVSNCPAAQKFTVTLLGSVDPDDSKSLINDDTSTEKAQHVAMRVFLLGAGTADVIPNEASSPYTADKNGSLELTIEPGLVKTTESPTAGNVHITGQIQINYL